MIADGHLPRNVGRDRFDLGEERIPQLRVVAIGDQTAAAAFRVGDVTRVQVKGGALGANEVGVRDRVVGNSLVAECREGKCRSA
jgi:hypothetical protein